MSARAKLNSAYFFGSMFLAGIVGYWADSVIAFFIVAAVLLATSWSDGSIRMEPKKKR